jgi:hypothetical protein
MLLINTISTVICDVSVEYSFHYTLFPDVVHVVFMALFSYVHIACQGNTLCGFYLCISVRCFHLFGGVACVGLLS